MRIWSIGRHFTYPDGESYDILVDGQRQSHATSLELATFIVDACNDAERGARWTNTDMLRAEQNASRNARATLADLHKIPGALP
mgnify:CR=1 FL=1